MARSTKRSASLRRQPGFLTVQRERLIDASAQPLTPSPDAMPSAPRWRTALDQATQLMQGIVDQMQEYSDESSLIWHNTYGAERFHECLNDVIHIHESLDDMRSNF